MSKQVEQLDARIPHWNLADLMERLCPVCGLTSDAAAYVRPDGLKVKRCPKCATLYVSPAPSQRQIDSFYATYDEQHRREPETTAKELRRTYKGADPLTQLEQLRMWEVSSLMSFAGAAILDVGFGRAQALHYVRERGAVPYGVEPDPKAIEYAKALGIEHVYHGTIDAVPADVKFDLIMMNDLVEHPLDPMALLKTAAHRLAPKGLLLIWTPSGDISEREANPTALRVDLEHMQYLTPAACEGVAAALRLGIVHLETLGFPGLKGIARPLVHGGNWKTRLKGCVRALPGFPALNRLRARLAARRQGDMRTGTYHLFCILRKPA